MNIVYATRATIPYTSAASLNSVQMCESLVELGHRVTLAIGRKFWRRNPAVESWSRYYGFEPRFDIVRLWEVPKSGYGFDGRIWRLADRLQALLYLRSPRLLGHRDAGHVPCLLEVHSALSQSERRLVGRAFERGWLRGVVVITSSLRDHLCDFAELKPFSQRFFVAPDAVNSQRFDTVPTQLNLQQVGYVGGLFPGKGMEQIVRVAARKPDTDFHVFGGRPKDVNAWRSQAAHIPRLKLWGHVAPAQVPACMSRFGIALLPNQPNVRIPNGDDIGRFTSPMKLFEYMAAGRAIIASDLPVLREVLRDEENCLLVPHDTTQAWVHAIERLQAEPQLAQQIAARAKHTANHEFSFT